MSPSGGLSASITDRDGFSADNARYAVLDESAGAVSVLAITPTGHPSEALYLERALAVAEGTRGFRFRSLGGGAFSALDPTALEPVGVIAVLATRGVGQRGRERLAEFVRGGGGLLVAAGPDVDPAILKDALAGVVETSWATRECPSRCRSRRTTAAIRCSACSAAPARWAMSGFRGPPGSRRPPAPASLPTIPTAPPRLSKNGPPAAACSCLAPTLNYRWNDFPLQPAFVPFVHETVRYLASPRTSRTDYLVGDLQAATTPGVVEVQGRRIAVNPDPRESDPTRMTAEIFQAGISRLNAAAAQHEQTAAQQQEDRQLLWRYGLLFMVVSLAAEGIIGRRLG